MSRNQRNNTRENWRQDARDSGSSTAFDNWRRSGYQKTRGLSGNTSFESRSTSNLPFRSNNENGNRFAKSSSELTDEEFIDKLLNTEKTEHVENVISSTQQFVKVIHSDLSDDLLVRILKLVARLCDSTTVSNKNYIVKVTMQQKFVKRVNLFLSLLLINDDKDSQFWKTFDETLSNMATVLENALNLMPMTMWEHVKPIIKNVKIVLPVLINEKQVNISPLTEEKLASLHSGINKVEEMFKAPENNSTDDQNGMQYEKDPDHHYRTISIYPNVTELIIPDRPYMRKNIVDRPYSSVAQYLDIHFRLLREDFVNPIREDVCAFLNNTNKRLFNIKIHRNVRFVAETIFRENRCFKIQFSVPEWISKSIVKGEQLKRFIHGTLLLFSDDNFNTMLSGKVINSDELKNGSILLHVPCGENDPDLNNNYLMIECIVFFEPYYQVLTVLKRLNGRSLPMEDYIVKINKETRRPKYMENVGFIKKVLGLNPSQDAALNAALSKEFVIIQGPPGTGKTFLGMKIVGEILKQRRHWQKQGPILIICFTNHALDQFLQGLQKYTGKIARLGGQSNNMQEIASEYGPEADVLKLVRERIFLDSFYVFGEHLVYDDEEERQIYKRVLRKLKRGPPYNEDKYSSVSRDLAITTPYSTQQWMMGKGDLDRKFFDLKSAERDIKSITNLENNFDTLKSLGIFKTDFLFEQNIMYHYFTDFDLACWLLCDDGTISTNMDTMETMGFNSPKHDQVEKIYNFLSDCLLDRSPWNFFITIDELKQYVYELEEQFKIYRYDQRLQEYLTFVRLKVDYLRMCLTKKFGPPDVDTSCSQTNPWSLSSKSRWELYNYWTMNAKTSLSRTLEREIVSYRHEFAEYNILREDDNVKLLKKMDIVGMTTTCAARMRSTIEALSSPIVIVEEAAEVLESHIVTALTNNCQHLILLGDHQQLRPTTSDYTVEKKYKLGISLFERMVLNNVQCHTLNVQHRMRPEISKLLVPTFYKDLNDGESVKNYPMITGVKRPIFFIDHTEPEEPYGDSSKMNPHEAKYLVQLAIYLLNNDYKPEEITILAAYLGQTYILKEERNKAKHPLIRQVQITPVDNFQGEENRIILLSLVRSNVDNNIGFLSVDNRVCVALSRAREGFYIMGNMKQLCASSEIWKPIKVSLESQDAVGRHLALCCRHHEEYVTFASNASDFAKVPEGGCTQACNAMMTCGHQCKKKCHGYDVDHKDFQCMEPCKKSLCDIVEHRCKKSCFELCGSCYYPVTKTLPCGHTKTVQCSTDIIKVKCEFLIEIEPACKHLQQVQCHTIEDFVCKVGVEKELSCGHKQMVPCGFHHDMYNLNMEDNDIGDKLEEDDEKSSIKEEICTTQCNEALKCGHLCRLKCHKNDDPKHTKYKCLEPCTKNKTGCRHPDIHPKCNLPCGEKCPTCKIHVMSSGTCSHFNRVECYKESTATCNKVCNKKLPCGHACPRRCSEKCETTCHQKIFKVIPECGHKVKVSCNKTPSKVDCKQKCARILACGHNCKNLCRDKCAEKCMKQCTKILGCGHKCINLCYQPCACKREKFPECNHIAKIKCGDILKQEDCSCSALKEKSNSDSDMK